MTSHPNIRKLYYATVSALDKFTDEVIGSDFVTIADDTVISND
jgi:hypothetical protein